MGVLYFIFVLDRSIGIVGANSRCDIRFQISSRNLFVAKKQRLGLLCRT